MTTEELFKTAQRYIKEGPSDAPQPNNDQKLRMYAFFKQATDGPCTGKRPGMMQVVERAKYDAWAKLGIKMTKPEAQEGYAKVLTEIIGNESWKTYFGSTTSGGDAAKPQPKPQPQVSMSGAASVAPAAGATSTFRPDFLRGKVALITGGGTGICKGITSALMKFGCDTVIVSRTLQTLQEAARELEAQHPGRRCFAVAADVRDFAKLSEAFDTAIKEMKRIDVLVNGAAGNFLCSAEALSSNAMKTVLEIDTLGTFNASKLAFQKWMKQHGGSIINCSMTLHYTGMPMQVHAASAKAAIDSMAKVLAVEWGLSNVRVNNIAIGPIEGTEGTKRLIPKQVEREIVRKTPLQRIGQSDDIANTVLFLVSDAANWITGSTIVVDGGNWLTTSGLWYPDIMQMGAAKSKL